jgi:glucuronate isomerase
MQSIEAVMDAELQRIKRILEIYLARSEAALTALASEDWDGFDSAMRWRNAAFHNFRAADHMLRSHRSDYLAHPELQSLGASLQDVNQSLSQGIENAKVRLSEKLVKISQHRARIGKFYSGVQEEAGFQKSV